MTSSYVSCALVWAQIQVVFSVPNKCAVGFKTVSYFFQISVLYEFISATYNAMESDKLLNVTVKRTGKPESPVYVGKIIISLAVKVLQCMSSRSMCTNCPFSLGTLLILY